MGKKYIVEIGRLERLYKAYVNGNGKPNMTWLSPEVDLTPYTEPDLEQVRKEGYEKGWKEAEDHYFDGYSNGYDAGLDDAWKAARKIANMPYNEEEKAFGSGGWAFIEKHTASEAIEKIRQYEQEKKEKEEQIQVGDEVNAPFGKAIVVNVDSVAEKIWFLYADGHGGFDFFKDAPTKTGRHFPEIATVLEKMREESNG